MEERITSMNIHFPREAFAASFQLAAVVAPQRSPKPILQNVKLEATESQTTLLATDMDISIRVDVDEVIVEQPGSAVLHVARFGNILRESRDERLRIESGAQGVEVFGDHSKFKLPAGNPDEFPKVAQWDAESYCELPARLLKRLIRRTLFATDNESNRFALGGILLDFAESSVTAVGTDGRRLAKMEGSVTYVGEPLGADAMPIIPSRALQVMERSLIDTDESVQLAVQRNSILLRSAKVIQYARLLEGRFPRWRDVFPERSTAQSISVAVGPLYAALRQASIVASEESRGVDFTFGDGSLVLEGSAADVGQSRVEFPISYDGPSIVVSLDHRYVADFLKVLDAESVVTIEVQDEESAAVFTTDDGYGYVVMPLARDR